MSRDREAPKPLTNRAIIIGAITVILIGGAILTILLVLYGTGAPQDLARLEAVRTTGAVVVGTGGAIALLLAARRQRSTELTLQHQQEVAERAEYDASERRITELYTKAADQLGSDRAPVRLAGLYALARLGETAESQRQTIVNVVCAYLRMPFAEPEDADARQEKQVRRAAQEILYTHRRPDRPDVFWAVTIDLDDANLTETLLLGADFAGASLFRATLNEAELMGADFTNADLSATSLIGTQLVNANLTDATLDRANLDGALLAGATLSGTLLSGARWSTRTQWPTAEFAHHVTAASTDQGDGTFLIGDLRLPSSSPRTAANANVTVGSVSDPN
ncbi:MULTISPECIES: pentapeptide repeat-containing protein [unclassified Amycolatopsis]|uniref:pentapeptide repeat-containing protein n=1 Tax=unclassified Amycolatopsis TaxID=2618356 RepID=UPI0028744425|nr:MULTISPECIES: pentapeptide repeat-containing protein [unclassified Amycolatopsis]MDS0140095.1 pentapeptide repeat-containing protein [Amycolatopsis sp. 505]MDS0148649.1 pentapeptide repeat-containing protein [Amycolatopsis sp. CM201R]